MRVYFCAACGTRLDPRVVAEGHQIHATCEPEFQQWLYRRRLARTGPSGRPAYGPRHHKPGGDGSTPVMSSPPSKPEIPVSHRHPATAKAMARKVRGVRLDIVRALRRHGPMTDFELEQALRRTHQSISGARRACVIDGLIVDSGNRRRNQFGNIVIVWRLTEEAARVA